MGLDSLHVRDLQACGGKSHFGSRNRRCRHVCRLHPCKAVGDDLYFYLGICAECFGLIPRRHDDAAIAVRGESLGAKAVDTPGPHRFQFGQTLGCRRGPTLVLIDQFSLFLINGDLSGNM